MTLPEHKHYVKRSNRMGFGMGMLGAGREKAPPFERDLDFGGAGFMVKKS